eukprot:1845227-Prymnesium_polylepis.1
MEQEQDRQPAGKRLGLNTSILLPPSRSPPRPSAGCLLQRRCVRSVGGRLVALESDHAAGRGGAPADSFHTSLLRSPRLHAERRLGAPHSHDAAARHLCQQMARQPAGRDTLAARESSAGRFAQLAAQARC